MGSSVHSLDHPEGSSEVRRGGSWIGGWRDLPEIIPFGLGSLEWVVGKEFRG